ncbi:Kelch repeat-containing protein [Sediminicola luteus]|uniref:Galactose oxidase n=1 Tax=Sediminicola luteus TaxID=319238 RepID=A0ABV2TUY1_9FLAO
MKQLFFLWLLACFTSHSQTIDIGNFYPQKIALLKESTSELFLFQPDSVSIIDLRNPEKTNKIPIQVPFQSFVYDFQPISYNSKIYFIEYHGGRVFQYRDSKFIRKDNSFTHKMQINSTVFVHQNSIYKYGGYGFWSHRNFFTFYDEITSEWQMIAPANSKILPEGTQYSWVTNVEDDIYIFGGIAMDRYNPEQFYPYNKVHRFNTEEASWQELGDSKMDLSQFNKSIPFGNKHIFLDNNDDYMYEVDILNNTLKTYNKLPLQKSSLVFGLGSFYFDGSFYCFIWNPRINGAVQLSIVPEDEFFGKLIREEDFYTNNTVSSSVILGMISALVICLLFYWARRWYMGRNKIKVTLKGLSYKNKAVDIDDKSIATINLLLRSKTEVNSKEIMDLVENKNLNFAHNTKIKNKLIEEINFKLRTVLGIKTDPITFQKSKIDKRIKTYTIERRYFLIR